MFFSMDWFCWEKLQETQETPHDLNRKTKGRSILYCPGSKCLPWWHDSVVDSGCWENCHMYRLCFMYIYIY